MERPPGVADSLRQALAGPPAGQFCLLPGHSLLPWGARAFSCLDRGHPRARMCGFCASGRAGPVPATRVSPSAHPLPPCSSLSFAAGGSSGYPRFVRDPLRRATRTPSRRQARTRVLCDPARLRILFFSKTRGAHQQCLGVRVARGRGCARAADRPRQTRVVPSGGERTGRRARDPDPVTGPAHPRDPTSKERSAGVFDPSYSLLTNRNEIGRLSRMSFRKQT